VWTGDLDALSHSGEKVHRPFIEKAAFEDTMKKNRPLLL